MPGRSRLPRTPLRIVILGTFDASRPSRATIIPALDHSARRLGVAIDCTWVPPARANASILRPADGVFVAPGPPTENLTGILHAIRFARLHHLPCLGTCGGFQRIVAEFELSELGLAQLTHAEISPDAVDPFFSPLACSLVGQEAVVELRPGSRIAEIHRASRTTESFFCGYGINAKYLAPLQRSRLLIAGTDPQGDVRVVELADHPFFMATLYVPQVRSTAAKPHPLITAFLAAAQSHRLLATASGTTPPASGSARSEGSRNT